MFSSDAEDKLKDMFEQIQEPFERHKPACRKNFLAYSYVLQKFCELLGVYNPLPLMRNRDGIKNHDEIWSHICEELDWRFIPTI